MKTYLSKSEITSFYGNVFPLYLKSDEDIRQKNIAWSTDSDCIVIKTFSKNEEFCFNDGILVTAVKEGCGKIVCTYEEKEYVCNITVVPLRHASRTDKMYSYPADLHIHTSQNHEHNSFAIRTDDLPYQCIESIMKTNSVECCVLTDHASTTNNKDFFRCFVDDEEYEHKGLVVFPGAESQVTIIEKDRYGLENMISGETVTLNAMSYTDSKSWEEHFEKMSDSPFAFSSIAHPSVVGWSVNGIWSYDLYNNSLNPDFGRMMKLVEMGKGNYKESCMLYQYSYSQALDCGLKVSPCCTSDCHGEYVPSIGKTFIVSPEKSKEMFYDAIISNRVYACENGDVDLKITVNDCIMGETMPLTDTYRFHVEATLFKGGKNAKPVKCSVVSDYGQKLVTLPFDKSLDFELKSDSARYFYILLTDIEGRKTWSSPFWTGREFDDFSKLKNLKPICKKDFTAFDETSNCDAGVIINDNPRIPWISDNKTASLVIDMKKTMKVAAIGHYAPLVYRFELDESQDLIKGLVSEFAAEYRISTSIDGAAYTEVKRGYIRAFGGEDILMFEPSVARYVKFEVLSTVGADTEKQEFADAKVKIAELSVFEPQP